jgi:hypothetical protein
LQALDYLGFTMFQSSALPLFLLSFFQHTTHGSPIQPRSANSAVITSNFMDPSVIELQNGYYAFGGANGNPAGINVRVAYSQDFLSWTVNSGYDALPVLGAWAANPGHVWSPDINQLVCGLKIVQTLAPVAPCARLATGSLLTEQSACLERRFLHPLLLRHKRRLPTPTLHRRRRRKNYPWPLLTLLGPPLLPSLRRRRHRRRWIQRPRLWQALRGVQSRRQ